MTGMQGSIAMVTGSTGGVGQAVSAWLGARGTRVFGLDRRAPETSSGDFLTVDVLDPASIESCTQEVVRRAGRVDMLVTAAGLAEEPTPAEEMTDAVWDLTIGVNLRGAFLTCRSVGRVMLQQGAGRIVNIASMSGNHVVNVPQQQV
ncbi:MAG TPA: SDR family NAD(P)-dependent oxidoreductase, partial [Jatrophihabitantaceae bacterium]|nr:SDR family NAD(P)-dependent oxidoreductase [Jatrophihabitantaceae bacterium]